MTRPRASGTPRPARQIAVLRGHEAQCFRRVQPRRVAHRHRVLGRRPRASGTPRPASRSPSCSGHEDWVVVRRLQPGRLAHRHGVGGQDRARLGRRDRQADRRPAAATRNGSWSAAFSPDGSRIVTASWDDDRARLGRRDRQADRRPARPRGLRCAPPPSARTGRASSRRLKTRPRASGTPRPARRSPSCSGHENLV